ncbi:g1496 [Coccomyxa elongata]
MTRKPVRNRALQRCEWAIRLFGGANLHTVRILAEASASPVILDVGSDGASIECEGESALVVGGSPTNSVRSDSPEITGRLSPRGFILGEAISEDIEQRMNDRSDSGQVRSEDLGYKQELSRRFGVLSSSCACFSLMSFMTGIAGSLSIGYMYGGPLAAVWGWIIASMGNLLVGLAMAEIASSYPIAGGPYCWTLELGGTTPLFTLLAWMTGWLNVLGQLALTASTAYLVAIHLSVMFMVSNGHQLATHELFLTYAICLVVAGVISCSSTRGIRLYAVYSATFLVAGGAFIVAVLPMLAPTFQPASYVFTYFDDSQRDALGLPNNVYVFFLGLLMAQYSYVGYEVPAQLAEETIRADVNAPRAIVLSLLCTSFCGFIFLLVVLFCIQDADQLYSGVAKGYIVVQVFYDVFEGRYGSGMGGVALSGIPLIAIFNSTIMCMTNNARMLWSFSRDGGVPLYCVWAALNHRTKTPINATWAMTALAFLLGIPILFSTTAFMAIASICFTGLYTSYAVPIGLRIVYRERFEAGPFQLARLQPFLNILALLWIALIVACLSMPTKLPVTFRDLNWTPISLGLVILAVLISWSLPGIGARHWFRGKNHTLRPAAPGAPVGRQATRPSN